MRVSRSPSRPLARRGRYLIAAAASLLLCLSFAPARALAGEAADQAWRSAADNARVLIENDLPAGYRETLRLQAALAPTAPPADRARILNILSRVEMYRAETARSDAHARAALALASQHGDRIGQAEAELNLVLSSIYSGKIDALIAATIHGAAVLEGTDRPDLLSEALLRMSMMHHRLGQLEESVSVTMKNMEIARRSHNPLALTYAYQGLAASFSLNGRQIEARDNYLEMRKQARAAHSRMLEGGALIGLAVATEHLGDKVAAEAMIGQAVTLFREVGAPFARTQAVFNLAELYRHERRWAEALPLLTEVVDTYRRLDNVIGLWFTLNARSEAQAALGEHAAAWSDAERAYQLARKIGLASYMSESARRLAALLAARGAHQRAYAYALEAASLTSNAQRSKETSRLVELVKRYEADSKQREFQALRQRNQQQSEELQKRRLERRWLWSTLSGAIAVLAVTAFLLLRLRRSHATIQSLNAGLEQRVQARTAELRLQTRYLRTLIDTLPWRIWFKDTASRYLALNQAAADDCGLGADALMGRSDQEVRAPALAAVLRADDLEVMESRRGKIVEERLETSDGSAWIETFKAPVLDDDDSVLGTVGFARDISERKAAEAARDLALAEAQRLAQVRSDFLAQMSHELRTPLNGILGYAQILRRDGGLDETQQRAVGVIQHSGSHLLTLINDILDLAKIEAGKFELAPSDIALARFIEAIAEMIRVKADQKELGFVCALAPGLPAAIRIDEKRLRQILLNLLSNAVKFTDRGEVRLAVAMTAAGKLRFEVHDSGVGIAADQRDIIFQPFEQTGDAGRRRGGTGLGLAITRQFLHLMGSEIAVTAAAGGGSIFGFELEPQVVPEPRQAEARARQASAYEGARRTVLVADDVRANRVLALDMLAPLGFRMLEAADGHEAVAQAVAHLPDLILMDIVMPGLDGLQAHARLRTHAGLERVPVIAMSAGATAAERERYLAAGMAAFLPKPIDYDELMAHLAALLDLQWSVEPAPAPVVVTGLEPPPPSEMAVLHQLALIGNMHEIGRRADHIAALDARYRPFAASLSTLAGSFQSKAVLRFVEGYLAPQPGAGAR